MLNVTPDASLLAFLYDTSKFLCRSTPTQTCEIVIIDADPGTIVSSCACNPTPLGQLVDGIIPLLLILLWGFAVLMIADCTKHKFKNPARKTKWILLLAVAGPITSLLYYFWIVRKRDY